MGNEVASEDNGCGFETHPGVWTLSNGDPGYPAEYCDDLALPGEEFCEAHLAAVHAEDIRDEHDSDDQYDPL